MDACATDGSLLSVDFDSVLSSNMIFEFVKSDDDDDNDDVGIDVDNDDDGVVTLPLSVAIGFAGVPYIYHLGTTSINNAI